VIYLLFYYSTVYHASHQTTGLEEENGKRSKKCSNFKTAATKCNLLLSYLTGLVAGIIQCYGCDVKLVSFIISETPTIVPTTAFARTVQWVFANVKGQ
jgi:hypothetical protein